jgi:N-acetylmuramoyl-L-alanine amidase
MNKVIAFIALAAAILAGCSAARKAQQTAVTGTDVTEMENRAAAPQPVVLDLTELFQSDFSGRKVTVNDGVMVLTTDSEGKIAFEIPLTDTISLFFSACPSAITLAKEGPQRPPTGGCSLLLATSSWCVPYTYTVKPDGSVERKAPWVEFRRTPDPITGAAEFDFLCKSDYPATVSINGEKLKQYSTGIFFTTVKFNEGVNKVTAEAVYPDGRIATCEQEYIYEKRDMTRQPFPLWVERRSFEPTYDLELLPGEEVAVSFMASKGQDAYVEVRPGRLSIKCFREDHDEYSIYTAAVPLRDLAADRQYDLTVRLVPMAGAPIKTDYIPDIHRTLTVRQPEDFPLVKVKNEFSRLTYNLGSPRLGGPLRAEFSPGVVLKTSGKFGSNYRIRLSNVESGIISEDDVELAGGTGMQPSYIVTGMTCGPADDADIVTIPYLEPVPYEVYPDPNQKRLVITLFGAESASTWVTHRKGCRIIDRLTWEQSTPETFRVYVNLNSEDLWGYDIRPSGRSLVLRLKYPPVFDLSGEKPLAGLKIAIEAGHGGYNTGAIGLSGLVEKDINLDLSFRLADLLQSKGAEVVQVRDSDKYMLLTDKRAAAVSSGAHMLISIHANAGGRGYLSTKGTSTYWHNPFWAPLAQAIYYRLLETGLSEFGVVGSFNYTVTRTSQLPAVLVEQAFMSNAEDEEMLADPEFRQQEAHKIYEGIVDYLKYMKRETEQ